MPEPSVLRFPITGPVRLERPAVMGVLNVTPDSFSDGGRFDSVEAALAQARVMAAEGAAILDVGGESTRPGAERVGVDDQVARVVPVVSAVRAMLDAEFAERPVAISVDTTRTEVAAAALDAGAEMLNDVSGGTDGEADAARDGTPTMAELAAERGVPLVLMHMRGQPKDMQKTPSYGDVVAEVGDALEARLVWATAAGVDASQVWLDPGIGFGKTLGHNLALLAALGDLFTRALALGGGGVMLGTSRKSMFGKLDPTMAEPGDRLPGTLATTALGVAAGVGLFRVHDVLSNVQAVGVSSAIVAASGKS